MQQRILQKHHQGSCLEYEIDNLYDSHLEGRHIFLSLHALMLLSVLLAYQFYVVVAIAFSRQKELLYDSLSHQSSLVEVALQLNQHMRKAYR